MYTPVLGNHRAKDMGHEMETRRMGGVYFHAGQVFPELPFSVFGESRRGCECIVRHSVAARCELQRRILRFVLSRPWGHGNCHVLVDSCSRLL